MKTPIEADFIVRNDLEDYDDGCVNSLIIATGIVTAETKKKTTILTIREEIDGSVGQDKTLTIKLPAEYWPDNVIFAEGTKYALLLVRVRDE